MRGRRPSCVENGTRRVQIVSAFSQFVGVVVDGFSNQSECCARFVCGGPTDSKTLGFLSRGRARH